MRSSPEKSKRTTGSHLTTEQCLRQRASTRYALILGEIPLNFEGWMTSEQARAWLLSDAMPPTRRHKVVMKCPVCGETFSHAPSKLRAQRRSCEELIHTCSNKCMGVMRTWTMTQVLTCQECGKEYRLSKSERARRVARGDTGSFCSNECYGKYRSRTFVGEKHHNYSKVTLVCTHCAKEFLRAEGAAKTYRTTNPFCTKACYAAWLTGRATQKDTGRGSLRSYPPEFKRMRKEMLSKEALCVVCMFPARDLHHRDGDPENNSTQNLVPVCRRCHRRHHEGPPHPALSPLKK